MIDAVMFTINQLRDIWNTDLPVAVADCGKYDDASIEKLQSVNALILNVCSNPSEFGMSKVRAQKKLRSLYCKPAVISIKFLLNRNLV
jgi:hypothetical protein